MTRTVFIETYGCQMNEADSELMYGLLRHQGYALADAAENADVVLLNTCAVRERAEERIFGRLGWLKSMKAARPGMVLGVTGCMAERMRDALVQRAPYVDLVVGPDAYRRLPDLLSRARDEDDHDPLIDVRLDRDEKYQGVQVDRLPGISGWITVVRGCDKFCSFCIVPFVRGRERSLPPDEVVAEARQMATDGFKEVTLLGQTVSSYYERGTDFADLLALVHEVDGIERIRFTSPYPNDFSPRLLETLGRLPRVGRHLHLPVQSGSTRILKEMRRGYTEEGYRGLIDQVRATLPDFALTTDIIVGYPGETEADFEATLALVRDVRFDGAFMFHYSEREGTRAARTQPDDVPSEVKGERLQRLVAEQEAISRARYADMVGRDVEVLVTGRSRKNEACLVGRTSCFKTTVLAPGPHGQGDLVRARVTDATSHTLFAEAST
jgi:tRNA-2-methylthio-N6-dimethylallyladenosine synthase